MSKTKWDLVEDLGTAVSGVKASRIGNVRRRRSFAGAMATSFLAISLAVAIPNASSGAVYQLTRFEPHAAAVTGLPERIVLVKRPASRRTTQDNDKWDTRQGLTSRQLANRLSVFFKPAAPEPEETGDDYNFF